MVKNMTKSNMGKVLERLLDMTHRQYLNKGQADIRKVPTPFQTKKYNPRNGEVTGYYTRGEWVDYVGVGDGRAIVFDAKETSIDRFELRNIHDHQFDLLKSWWEKGATSFLIVSFAKRHEEIYLLEFDQLQPFWEGYIGDGPKSIPRAFFIEHCDLVKSRNGIVLDYLYALRKDV